MMLLFPFCLRQRTESEIILYSVTIHSLGVGGARADVLIFQCARKTKVAYGLVLVMAGEYFR